MKIYILAIAIPSCDEPIVRAFSSGEARNAATKEWLKDSWPPNHEMPAEDAEIDKWLVEFDPDLTFDGDIDLLDLELELEDGQDPRFRCDLPAPTKLEG